MHRRHFSAKRSTTVQSRGALLNEVLRYTIAARVRSPHVGFEKKERKNQPVSRYLRAWVGSIRSFFTMNRVKLGLGTVRLFCVQTGVGRFGNEKNICSALYCLACRSGARSNPKLSRKLWRSRLY